MSTLRGHYSHRPGRQIPHPTQWTLLRLELAETGRSQATTPPTTPVIALAMRRASSAKDQQA